MPSLEYSPDGSASARPTHDVDRRYLTEVPNQGPHQTRDPQRQHQPSGDELRVVGLQQRADPRIGERGRHLLDDHPHHLLGCHAVRDGRGDERPGARAHVDVELVDGPVHGEQIQRPQRADLIDPAGEATATEHERRPRPATSRSAARSGAGAVRRSGVKLDNLPHQQADCTAADPRATATFPAVSG